MENIRSIKSKLVKLNDLLADSEAIFCEVCEGQDKGTEPLSDVRQSMSAVLSEITKDITGLNKKELTDFFTAYYSYLIRVASFVAKVENCANHLRWEDNKDIKRKSFVVDGYTLHSGKSGVTWINYSSNHLNRKVQGTLAEWAVDPALAPVLLNSVGMKKYLEIIYDGIITGCYNNENNERILRIEKALENDIKLHSALIPHFPCLRYINYIKQMDDRSTNKWGWQNIYNLMKIDLENQSISANIMADYQI